jgi:hypothetical protein
MNMPGFTAEASVYEAKVQYHRAGIAGQASGIGEDVRVAVRPPVPELLFGLHGVV